eukprot:4334826-Amphidinium_carterae.1
MKRKFWGRSGSGLPSLSATVEDEECKMPAFNLLDLAEQVFNRVFVARGLDRFVHVWWLGSEEDDGFVYSCVEGPKELDESMRWAEQYVKKLEHSHPDGFKRLVSRLCSKSGIRVVSDYSGMGCPELAMSHIVAAVRGQGCGEPQFTLHRASDISAVCQTILLAQTENVPRHVFGDITKRVPVALEQKMRDLQRAALASYDSRIEAGEDAKDVHQELGPRLFRCLCKTMSQVSFGADRTAYCLRHHQRCRVQCEESDPADAFTMAVAGVSCTDYSAMGKRRALLGDSIIPYVIWSHEVLAERPNIIVIECTVHFPEELLEVFQEHYNVQCHSFSPTDLGFAAQRPRKYMVLWDRSKFQCEWSFEKGAAEPQNDAVTFGNVFGRQRIMRASCFFRSSDDEEYDEIIKPLAAKRGLPEVGMGGRKWKLFEVVAPG